MKRLTVSVILLTLTLSPLAAIAKVECPELSEKQLKVLKKSWSYGENKMGEGWGVKMAAIAYQETKLGKDIKGKGSYGTFQLRPTTVAYMNGIKPTGKNLKSIKMRLHNEFQYSAIQAHKYLDFWKDKGYSDAKVYRSYNGGYSNSSKSRYYSKSVQRHVSMFEQCYVYKDGKLIEKSLDSTLQVANNTSEPN